MSWGRPTPFVARPTGLTGETVAQLLEVLCELGRGLENHYADQLHRYFHPRDARQQPLWLDDDPPF